MLLYSMFSSRTSQSLPLAAIPFRIISFADPYHLTPIESHLYKKHPGGGHILQAKVFPLSSCSPVPNPFRISTYEKRACNPFGIRTSKTQDLKPFRICTYEKRGGGAIFRAKNLHCRPRRRRYLATSLLLYFVLPWNKCPARTSSQVRR